MNDKFFPKKAILNMTDLIRRGEVLTMQRFTTQKGYDQLFNDTLLSTKDPRLNLLRFRENDIKKVHPTNVTFVERNRDSHLFIDVFFSMLRTVQSMAVDNQVLKDLETIEKVIREGGGTRIPEMTEAQRIILAEIYARFHRDYSKEAEWNIEFFKVKRVKIIYSKHKKKN